MSKVKWRTGDELAKWLVCPHVLRGAEWQTIKWMDWDLHTYSYSTDPMVQTRCSVLKLQKRIYINLYATTTLLNIMLKEVVVKLVLKLIHWTTLDHWKCEIVPFSHYVGKKKIVVRINLFTHKFCALISHLKCVINH